MRKERKVMALLARLGRGLPAICPLRSHRGRQALAKATGAFFITPRGAALLPEL
jgi:hypothetical protein